MIDTKVILVAILVVCILLSINLWILISTEHYGVARYEFESYSGNRLYFNGGSLAIRTFYLPLYKNDYNLTKGDDILIHYAESILGGRTYIRIEKLNENLVIR